VIEDANNAAPRKSTRETLPEDVVWTAESFVDGPERGDDGIFQSTRRIASRITGHCPRKDLVSQSENQPIATGRTISIRLCQLGTLPLVHQENVPW
jgi:hypothetical protein